MKKKQFGDQKLIMKIPRGNRLESHKKAFGDQKLIVKIMLVVVVIILGIIYKMATSDIVETQVDEVGNQVATTLYDKEGGSGSVIPGDGTGGNNIGGSGNTGGSGLGSSVDKNQTMQVPNTSTNQDGSNGSVTTTVISVSSDDYQQLIDALVKEGILSQGTTGGIDGMIIITGNTTSTSSIKADTETYGNKGDTIVVIKKDETTNEYSYIGTETVDADGKTNITMNGGTEFAEETDDGIVAKSDLEQSLVAGLYDADGVLLCTYEDSGMNVSSNYSDSSSDTTYPYYKTKETSPYYVITNKYPTTVKIVLPDNVPRVGMFAFYNCKSLSSVVLPDGKLWNISDSAFKNCDNLKNIVIPNSVRTIGDKTFYGCKSLTSINIPDSVTSFGSSVFSYCTNLTNVTIGNGITYIDATFIGCTNLTNVILPDNLKGIGVHTFWNCTSLENISIPNSVTSIGISAFIGCTSLTNVVIRNGITKLYNNVFGGCSSLTSVTILGDVTSIGTYTFSGCTKLRDITISDKVTSIGECAFKDCTSLTNFVIPESVTTIGKDAFKNVSHITYHGTATGSPWGALSIN